MKARALVTVIVLLGMLAFVGEAQAEPFTPRAETYFTEALAHWARPAPDYCGGIVTRELVPAGSLGEYLGEFNGEEGCRIAIDESVTAIPCQLRELVFHETGHLVGLEHTSGGGIMDPEDTWQFCRKWKAHWRAAHRR